MTAKQLFILGASMLAAALAGGAVARQADEQYVQVAEIEVDPVQLDAFRAAVQEQIDAAIRKEPGVLVLYAVYEKGNPTHVKVFENLPGQERLRSSPRIVSFQEIQDDGGEDGEVAQANPGHPDHARRPIEVRGGNLS